MDKRMRRSLVIALFAWFAFLLVLSTLHKKNPAGVSFASIEIPAYPGAVKIERHRVSSTDWQSVQYKVSGACPSDEAYRFYDRWFRENGWHRIADEKPAWRSIQRGGNTTLILTASWLERRELLRADLRVTCRKAEAGESVMEVSCATTRTLLPRQQPATGPLPLPR